MSVSTSIQQIAAKTAKGGIVLYNAANDGIGVAPFHGAESKMAADMQAKLDAALAGMKAGTVGHLPAEARLRQDPRAADRQLVPDPVARAGRSSRPARSSYPSRCMQTRRR